MHTFGGYPRFSDGELDLWPTWREALPDRAAINSPARQEVEQRRQSLINKLGRYAARKGTAFSVIHPANVRIVHGSFHDIWAFGLRGDGSTVIQIPRYAVSVRPQVEEAIEFRPEVPAFLILGSMAHELGHRDRALRDPERHQAIYNDSGFQTYNRHELDLSSVRHEELTTDVEAYGILQAVGVPLTPHDYIATVPLSSGYHQELANLLR